MFRAFHLDVYAHFLELVNDCHLAHLSDEIDHAYHADELHDEND